MEMVSGSDGRHSAKEKNRFLQNKASMSAKRSTLEDENVGSRLEPSLSTSRKVILPNKANSSSSSTNNDTSIRCDYRFSEGVKSQEAAQAALSCGARQS